MDLVDPEMFVITGKRTPTQVAERNVADVPSLTTGVRSDGTPAPQP